MKQNTRRQHEVSKDYKVTAISDCHTARDK